MEVLYEMEKDFVCTVCPLGCKIKAEYEGKTIHRITNACCPHGRMYVKNEILNPVRVLTSSVAVQGGVYPLVSVRTDGFIPKELMQQAMAVLHEVVVAAPVQIGDIIVKNLLGTGVNVIATKNVAKCEVD